MKKSIAISIGCLMVAAIAGCKYGPDYIDPFGCPVEESSKYALAPNTRWTSLRYGECPVLSKAGVWELRILKDGHRVQFVKFDDDWAMERPRIVKDSILASDEWSWVARQLEQADVTRWKTFYQPARGVVILDGTSWYLKFMDGSNVVGKVTGWNAWPRNFKAFKSILDAFDITQGGSFYFRTEEE